MTPSTMTLQEAIDRLPAALRLRYQAPLFIRLANEILTEFETDTDIDYLRDESGILLTQGVSEYKLPPGVRRILGAYPVRICLSGSGSFIGPDKSSPYSYTTKKGKISFDFLPFWSSEADVSGVTTTGSSSQVIDATAGKLVAATDNSLVTRLARVTHADTGKIEDRIIISNVQATGAVTVNGELDASAAAGDAYLVSANFLWLRYSRYFDRFVYDEEAEENGMSAVLPFDQELESTFGDGLKWKLNAQSDELSKETVKTEESFRGSMEKLFTSMPVMGESVPRNQAPFMPSFF